MKNKTVIRIFSALAISAAALISIPGCTTLTDAQKGQISTLEADVLPLVEQYAASGHVNYAQAIPVAIDSLAIFAPAVQVDKSQLEQTVQNGISQFTGGTSGSTGQKIAKAIVAALPANPTGAQVNAALTQAAVAASAGANPAGS